MPARRIAPLAAFLAAGALVAGCAATTPVQTQHLYPAGDGARIELTPLVRGENIMVLTEAEGAQGSVLGALVNDTGDDLVVTLSVAEGGLSVEIPAGQSVLLHGGDEPLLVPAIPAPPGAFLDVTLRAETIGSIDSQVPVLDGSMPQYADYVP